MNSIEIKDENADFEILLFEDELFVDYFNNFCEINFYPETLFYCKKLKQFRTSLTGDTNQNVWKIVNWESFTDVFRTNWLKYFICSYQCLEYRLSKLLAQVCTDPITHKNSCKTFQSVLLSSLTEENINNVRIISPCWEEFENQDDEFTEYSNDESSDRKYVGKAFISENQKDIKFITTTHGSDVKHEITIDDSNKVENEMIKHVFKSSNEVETFYDFLPEVAAQPLWLFWIETQKIKCMEKCHDWYSVESAVRRLRDTCYLEWSECLRLRRLLDRFCTFSTWSAEQLMPVADGVLHCLLTYWAPRYLLNKKHMKVDTLSSWKSVHHPNVCMLCKYSSFHKSTNDHLCNKGNNNNNNNITMETLKGTNSCFDKFDRRRVKTALSFQADKISYGAEDDVRDGGGDVRKVKSCDVRHSISVKDNDDDDDDVKKKCDASLNLRRIVSLDDFVGERFYHFLNESKNKEWLNGYHFLKECQRFKNHPDLKHLTEKASEIYARFLASGSAERIPKLGEKSVKKIHSELKFPRVEMFGEVEDWVVKDMVEAVEMFQDGVKEAFSELKTSHLEHQSVDDDDYLINGINESHDSLLLKNSDSTDPNSKSFKRATKNDKISSKKPQIANLRDIRRNGVELENFKNFLSEMNAATDYHFWLDTETYKSLAEKPDERKVKAEEIFGLYVNDKYYLGSDGPASKQQLEQNSMKAFEYNPALADKESVDNFLEEARKHVERRMETRWLPLYLAHCGSKNRKPTAIGRKDEMHNKSEFKNSFHKHSRDLRLGNSMSSYSQLSNQMNEFYFGQLTLDNAVLDNFIQFVALKDDRHEIDVQFLVEVQKYEELWSNAADISSIRHKANHIVSCFILPQFPPSIQISIDQELAGKIQNKSKKPTATLFHEAKKALLACLSKYFQEFDKLRNEMTNQDLFLHLSDERKQKHALKMRSNVIYNKKESINKMRALRRDMNKAPSDPLIDANVISWTYSEHMINLLNEKLKMEPEKQPVMKMRPPWRI